ncbi:MBL fold metallo-hydrolase [Desulfosporosinus sp. PR]|uniref:MBL fold metallo-hydrolase n=1 Tax=Candidatus Desulfosporosinus nitrosoreducens TaxID=3401928 RepID=UPI0027F252F2|nr:MBL fold metallo-hydrolase [Desulfosporosinus sp. PR]MDQ7094444.1 MBL fold metallo-hydrolase [Desulfosporosinus sp. PR]
MSSILNLGDNVYQIDVHDQGMPKRTSCYLIVGEKVALLETGPTPSIGYILDGLKSLGVPPEKVDYIILTHIHLDHAGGAGAIVQELPKARVFVHPKGAKHLSDPSQLIAGTKAIYKEHYHDFFGHVLPIPEDRVHTPGDGEILDLGGGRLLTFYYSPGHASHHLVIHDPVSRGVFGGDALGVRIHSLSELIGSDFVLPFTPPTEFDPLAAKNTLDRMRGLNLETIYFGHFGKAGGAPAILARNTELLEAYAAIGRRVLAAGGTVEEIKESLWELLRGELAQYGITAREHPLLKSFEPDLELSSQGIAYYFKGVGLAKL